MKDKKKLLRNEHEKLCLTAQLRRIQSAQQRAKRYLKPSDSLVDELLAERREASRRESD